jgi:hypothetical protein
VQGGLDVLTLSNLPMGSYLISAKAQFDGSRGTDTVLVKCSLNITDFTSAFLRSADSSAVTLPVQSFATIPLAGAQHLDDGDNVVLHCMTEPSESGLTFAEFVKLSAIQVGSLTIQ